MGVNGGRDGAPGGVWLWRDPPPEGTWPVDAWSQAVGVAGRMDPDTHAPSRDGPWQYFGRECWRTAPGAVFRYLSNGGGGWGNPLERDPAAVLRDVRNGYVTLEGARRDYGVVVTGDPEEDPEGLRVDEAATRALRARGAG